MQVVCKMSENSCGDEMCSIEVLGGDSVFFEVEFGFSRWLTVR